MSDKCKCKNKGCCSCGASSNSQSNSETVSNYENVYNTLPGHPIIMIDEESDISLFDETTGKGSGIWEGWALMDGKTHSDINNGNAPIKCNNMMNRVPVGAGDQYEVEDTFGEDTVSLTAAQNGEHNHTLTDSGHSHAVTDSGHSHTVTDPGHNHTITDTGHSHSVTNTMALSKNISYATHVETATNVTSGEGPDVPDTWQDFDVNLTGSVAVNSNTTGISLADANTGVTIDSAEAGVTLGSSETGVSIADSGAGEAHENRQPSYALVFVKRVYVPN
jgi:microcystin-dependent protein